MNSPDNNYKHRKNSNITSLENFESNNSNQQNENIITDILDNYSLNINSFFETENAEEVLFEIDCEIFEFMEYSKCKIQLSKNNILIQNDYSIVYPKIIVSFQNITQIKFNDRKNTISIYYSENFIMNKIELHFQYKFQSTKKIISKLYNKSKPIEENYDAIPDEFVNTNIEDISSYYKIVDSDLFSKDFITLNSELIKLRTNLETIIANTYLDQEFQERFFKLLTIEEFILMKQKTFNAGDQSNYDPILKLVNIEDQIFTDIILIKGKLSLNKPFCPKSSSYQAVVLINNSEDECTVCKNQISPDVPFGSSFSLHNKFVFRKMGEKSTGLNVYFKVNIQSKNMFTGMIQEASITENKNMYANIESFLNLHLESRGLITVKRKDVNQDLFSIRNENFKGVKNMYNKSYITDTKIQIIIGLLSIVIILQIQIVMKK